MVKKHTTVESLSNSLKPEIDRLNADILSKERSRLQSQASRLLRDVASMWAGYESSYQPNYYVDGTGRRTGQTAQGFGLSPVRLETEGMGVRLEVDLVLDDSHMWHNSQLGDYFNQGHSFMLISEGWEWQGGIGDYRGGDVYRFTHFDGVGIVDSLIDRYNTKDYDFTFYYEGEEYGGKRDRSNHSFSR